MEPHYVPCHRPDLNGNAPAPVIFCRNVDSIPTRLQGAHALDRSRIAGKEV
jgi:hypothetical protein